MTHAVNSPFKPGKKIKNNLKNQASGIKTGDKQRGEEMEAASEVQGAPKGWYCTAQPRHGVMLAKGWQDILVPWKPDRAARFIFLPRSP